MIITISHQKGGVGKSTLSYNLALELSRKHKVEMVDLDVQQTVSAYNGIRKEMGHTPLPVHVLSTTDELENYLESIDDDIIVIVDSGGFDSSLNRFVMVISDFLITPVSSEFTEILGLQKYSTILEEISRQTNKVLKTHVVLNKISPNQKKFDDVISFIDSSEHFEIMDSILKRRVDFANSVAFGFSVREFEKKSEASKELKSFVKEVKQKAGINGKKKN